MEWEVNAFMVFYITTDIDNSFIFNSASSEILGYFNDDIKYIRYLL